MNRQEALVAFGVVLGMVFMLALSHLERTGIF